jgi:hypothetical protein
MVLFLSNAPMMIFNALSGLLMDLPTICSGSFLAVPSRSAYGNEYAT